MRKLKKTNPKIILNIQLENDELENKVQIAMDEYVEDLVIKNLDDTIEKLVNRRVQALIKGNRYSTDGMIHGKTLSDYVKEGSEKVIEEAIQKNIKEIFAKKFAEML